MECVYDTGENYQSIDDTKCFIHRTRVSYVINNFSRSTKLRVVFDGPAKTNGGVCLALSVGKRILIPNNHVLT